MKVANRKAYYEYTILETFEAGIRLSGSEVKSIKEGRVQLGGSYVRIISNEAYLVNAIIPPYSYAQKEGYDERRTRKLLLHKKELVAFKTKLQTEHVSLVPLSIYTKHNLIKLEIGLGKGKRSYDKRKTIKERDRQREIERSYRPKG